MKTRRLLLVLATLFALLVGACATQGTSEATQGRTPTASSSSQPTTEPSEEPSTEPTPKKKRGMVVYFLLDQLDDDPPGPFLVPVYRKAVLSDPANMVMLALLEGPTKDEMAGTPALSTAIPEGTEILGVRVDDGLASVNLSGDYESGGGSFGMFARLAQVVYTLTRLPDIDEVAFEIEGEAVSTFSSEGIELDGPQRRHDYYDLLPPTFVDRPAWGQPVTSPVRVKGLSTVFEATSQLMLTDDDGEPLFEETVTATCGTGCWGRWSAVVPYEVDRKQFGALIVWEFSAKDGSRIHIREYPVRLR